MNPLGITLKRTKLHCTFFPLKSIIRLHAYVFTDLDPCLNVECPSFGVCRTYSAHESRCVCFQDCPSYQDPVCTANGTTYDNKCWHELSYCRGLENNLVYHPGSCEGKHRSQTSELYVKSVHSLSRNIMHDIIKAREFTLSKRL